MKERGEYRRLSEIFKAISHPSRLMILDALRSKELCVQDLHDIVGSDLSTVSRHLSQLKFAGLLSDRRSGKKVIYRLEPKALDEIADTLAARQKV